MGLLSHVQGWFRYSDLGAWWQGRKDGTDGTPPIDQEAPPWVQYEYEVKQVTEGSMRQRAKDWHGIDRRLLGDYCSAQAELAAATKALKNATAEHTKAEKEHGTRRREADELMPEQLLTRFWYGAIMFVVGAVDLPFNLVVFRLLKEAEAATWVVAVGIAGILLLCAHFLPIAYKKKHNLVAIALVVIVAAAICGVAIFRESYMRVKGGADALGVDPRTGTLVFIALSVLVFAGAAVASYYAHDVRPEVVKAQTLLNKALKRLRDAVADLASSQRRIDRANQALARVVPQREHAFEAKRHEVAAIRDAGQRLIARYRTANMHARTKSYGAALPESFKRLPDINVPDALKREASMTWRCPGSSVETGTPST